jgi:zinc D-Ala-D-Ala carboxypeptidase
LKEPVMAERLSPHFTIAEAEHSNTAKARNISNALTNRDHIICAVHTSIFVLEPIRDQFGPFSPNSWYRSADLNAAVGGSSKSDHCKGRAVDIEIKGVDNLRLAHWISENLEFDQLISEMYVPGDPRSGWVHVSFRLDNNRMQRLTYTTDRKYIQGLPEL